MHSIHNIIFREDIGDLDFSRNVYQALQFISLWNEWKPHFQSVKLHYNI